MKLMVSLLFHACDQPPFEGKTFIGVFPSPEAARDYARRCAMPGVSILQWRERGDGPRREWHARSGAVMRWVVEERAVERDGSPEFDAAILQLAAEVIRAQAGAESRLTAELADLSGLIEQAAQLPPGD